MVGWLNGLGDITGSISPKAKKKTEKLIDSVAGMDIVVHLRHQTCANLITCFQIL